MDLEIVMNTLSLEDNLSNEPLKERTFRALIGNKITYIIWNEYRDYYCIWASQPDTVGKVVAGKITMSEPPPVDVTSEAGFSIHFIHGLDDSFREAAKFIALKLGINKPLLIYLCLEDFKMETVIEFVEVLLQIR